MKNFTASFFLLFFVSNIWAQEALRKELKGKITAAVADLEGIYVVNMQTEKVAITEQGGYFSVMAKPGDSLMVSSVQLKGKMVGLVSEDFEKELFFIKMEPMVHALDEVKIIRYNNINAVSLGIIPKGQKSYTPAERHLKTAGDFKAKDLLGLLGGNLQTDPIINAITGRTAMLKKELEVEKKEFLLARIENMFEEKFFVEKLKIPQLYVKGFEHYVIENERFVRVFNSKNKEMSRFILGELAVTYNEIIACESE